MTNQLTVTAVVVLVGLFAFVMGGGAIWLIHDGTASEAVAPVLTLAGTAIGGLIALLVSTRVAQDPAQSETITAGPTADPVP